MSGVADVFRQFAGRYLEAHGAAMLASQELATRVGDLTMRNPHQPRSVDREQLVETYMRRVESGGTVLVTNVHINNPERYWMEHFMEWYLIYRDEPGLTKLFPESLPQVKTYTDETGVNLFAEAVKPL